MATASKFVISNAYYGSVSNKQYSTACTSHMYVGKYSGRGTFRARLAIQGLSSFGEIGTDRVRIIDVRLYLARNDGGPTDITIGCSQSSAWDAKIDASITKRIEKNTSDYQSIDLTSFAEYIVDYPSKWFLHLRSEESYVRLDGVSRPNMPYITITWERVVATISGDRDSATLGADEVTFTITPETEGETHTLTYVIGDSEGVIAENAGNVIAWTPPLELASEITQEDSAAVEIRMTAFGADGRIRRTEVYYQTVTVPETLRPRVVNLGVTFIDALYSMVLVSGRSSFNIAPQINTENMYGSTIQSLIANLSDGQSIQWTSIEELEPDVFTAPSAQTGVFSEGELSLSITVVDSRGRSDTLSGSYLVLPYSSPEIIDFDVHRCSLRIDENEDQNGFVTDDVGEYVAVTLIANAASVMYDGVEYNTLAYSIVGENTTTGEIIEGDISSVSKSSDGLSVFIVANNDIFTNIVGQGDAWVFTVVVKDMANIEVVQYATVAPGHASLSISPDKWGAAVGMVATGNKDNPMFEVAKEYKSCFYGGVYDRNGIELVNNALHRAGFTKDKGTHVLVPDATQTDMTLYTAEQPGAYLVCFSGTWASNGVGERKLTLLFGGDTNAYVRDIVTSAYQKQQNIMAMGYLPKNGTIKIQFYQTSGGDLTMTYGVYEVIRVGSA